METTGHRKSYQYSGGDSTSSEGIIRAGATSISMGEFVARLLVEVLDIIP